MPLTNIPTTSAVGAPKELIDSSVNLGAALVVHFACLTLAKVVQWFTAARIAPSSSFLTKACAKARTHWRPVTLRHRSFAKPFSALDPESLPPSSAARVSSPALLGL